MESQSGSEGFRPLLCGGFFRAHLSTLRAGVPTHFRALFRAHFHHARFAAGLSTFATSLAPSRIRSLTDLLPIHCDFTLNATGGTSCARFRSHSRKTETSKFAIRVQLSCSAFRL